MTIGVCGPVDLGLLECSLPTSALPKTPSFPLVSHFINSLLRRGYSVVVYTNSMWIEEPVVLESGPLKICVAREKPQPGRRFYRYEVKELRSIIQQHPADVISAFWSYEYALGALKTGIPTVVSLHDVASKVLYYHRDMFRFVRWIMNKTVVQNAQHLIANSDYTYAALNSREKAKTQVINNFYSGNLLQDVPEHVEKQNYIISVAHGFSKRKNISTSLKAFAVLRQFMPAVEYYLVGADMGEGEAAHTFAMDNNLEAGVKFLGQKPFSQALELIAKAKVLLHPSLEESFGMVILEAMVAGTAVIGGKKSGYVPYLLDLGRAGALCDVSSPDAIADTLLSLLTDQHLSEGSVKKAKAFAGINYAEPAMIDKHIAYLEKILKVQN